MADETEESAPVKKLLKIQAAADMYSVSDDYLRRAIKRGALKPIRLGHRTVLLSVADLDRYFKKIQAA